MKTILLSLGALATLATPTQAAIVWSGILDIPIPAATSPGPGLDGVYLDIAGFTSTTVVDDDFASTDVNFFLGGFAVRSSERFLPARVAADATSPIVNLAPGTVVDETLNYSLPTIGISDAHLGSDPGRFGGGTEGYLGFRFTPESSSETYNGWMRVTLSSNLEGTVHEWAYEDNPSAGIAAGVPEPSAALLVVASLGILARRRR